MLSYKQNNLLMSIVARIHSYLALKAKNARYKQKCEIKILKKKFKDGGGILINFPKHTRYQKQNLSSSYVLNHISNETNTVNLNAYIIYINNVTILDKRCRCWMVQCCNRSNWCQVHESQIRGWACDIITTRGQLTILNFCKTCIS